MKDDSPRNPEQLKELASLYVRDFMAAIYRLIALEGKEFDLLVGAGNSGAIMSGIAKLVYEFSERLPPPSIILPIQRYVSSQDVLGGLPFDNSVLLPDVSRDMPEIGFPSEVLFVDDESGTGMTIQASFALIRRALQVANLYGDLVSTIITEDRGLPKPLSVPGVVTRLISYPQESTIHHWRMVVNHFRPPMLADLEHFLAESGQGVNYTLNLGLGLPIKLYSGPGTQPYFDFTLSEKVNRNLPQLESIQHQLRGYLWHLYKSSIAGLEIEDSKA